MVESQSAECYLTSVQKFGALYKGHVDSFQCKKKEKGDKPLCEPQKHELNKPLKKILQKFRKVNKFYTLAIMWIELNAVIGEALSLSMFLDSA